MGNEQIDGTQQNELSPVIILNPYSTLNSEQLDQKISELVAEAAKAEGDLLDAILPVFEEMQKVLNQRGSPRNKHGKQSFGAWRSQKIKEIKSSPVGKDIAISSATLYRRMAARAAEKAGVVAPVKTFKTGTLVREKPVEKGDMPGRTGIVMDGKLGPAPAGFTNISFFKVDGITKVGAVRVKTDTVAAALRDLRVGDVMNHLDIDRGTAMRYDGLNQWSVVEGILTGREQMLAKIEAKKDKKVADKLAKEVALIAAGGAPKVGNRPGQVTDAVAAANAGRHKAPVITKRLVTAEDRGEKKTTITDDKGVVILSDILKPETKPKGKPGPKAKKVAPSPDTETREGFKVETGLTCDPDLYPDTPGHFGPDPDANAHREKLLAGAAPAGVEPITTEETAV
jgi:hypothetical protein